MSMSLPQPQTPAIPQAPAPPPMFGSQQQPGQKPQKKSSQPTYLGGALATNPSNTGQRTLIGGA